MPNTFDVVLIEKYGIEGLTLEDVTTIYAKLNQSEAYPMEIPNHIGESSAMGFITAKASEKIDYIHDNLYQFVGQILGDMELESEDNTYEHQGLSIYLTRI